MVGGVGHDVQACGAVQAASSLTIDAAMLDLGRPGLGPPQPGDHRQAHRPGEKRQLNDDPDHHEAGPRPDRLVPGRGAVVLPGRAEHLLPALA